MSPDILQCKQGGIGTKSQREKTLERIQQLRYIDDIFFSVSLDGFKPGIELILRTVMDNDRIIVDELYTQKDVINWYGRSVRFDVFASADGKRFNCEIQREKAGAIPLRARYNSSLLDAREVRKGTDYNDLPETVVIMICEHDVFGKGFPLYHVERIIKETGSCFGDHNSIIYVNGECQDNSPLGRLMHDFLCRDADDMYYEVLADRMRYFKEDRGGARNMCEIMEEMLKEGREQEKVETWAESIRNLMRNLNLTAQQAMDALSIPAAEQEKVIALL